MKSLTLMIGLPCSGKSTALQQYFDQHPTVRRSNGDNPQPGDMVVLSSDDIIMELASGLGLDYNGAFDRFIKSAESIFWDRFRQSLNTNLDVVIDRTNMTIKSRARLLQP
jgi:AAA domain